MVVYKNQLLLLANRNTMKDRTGGDQVIKKFQSQLSDAGSNNKDYQ